MRTRENRSIYKDIFRCCNCNSCVGRWPEEECPFRFVYRGVVCNLRGHLHVLQRLLEGEISLGEDVSRYLYTCPLCGYCREKCIYQIDFCEIGHAVRCDMVEAGIGPRPEHRTLIAGMKNYDNPWGVPRRRRFIWAKGLDVKDVSREGTELLYYVGCTACSDPVLRGVARSTVALLRKAAVDFGMLYEAEKCCGSTTYWLGDEGSFMIQAKGNLDLLNSINVKAVVTSCAGCFLMLKRVYPEIVGEEHFEVFHSSEFIAELIESGQLEFRRALDAKITYHDPCHLGRHGGVYDAPRTILRAVPGVEFREMRRAREYSWCCGAGAGVRSAYMDYATDVAAERLREAVEAGADTLVSACPFCYQNLRLAVEKKKYGVRILDVTEIVDATT